MVDSLPSAAMVTRGLEGRGEVVVTCDALEIHNVQLLLSIVNSIFKQWYVRTSRDL